MRQALIGAFLAMAVAGCASVNYVEPQDGERARVRFAVGDAAREATTVALYDENAVVYGFANAECAEDTHWMSLLDGYLVRPDPRRMDMPLWNYHQNAAKEFYVAASRPMHVMFIGSMPTFNGATTTTFFCPVFVSADLSPGADYELVYRASGGGSCSVEMSQIVATPTGHERRVVREFDNALGSMSAGCAEFFRHY
jgi:hypothetical protein